MILQRHPKTNEIILEEWLDIPKYESLYQASNYGRIQSLDRNMVTPRGGKYVRKGQILKQTVNDKGYLCVSLYKKGKQKVVEVQQLIAMVFHNHVPCGHKIEVDHIDNIKTNNFYLNLQLITHRENTVKSRPEGTSKYVGVSFNKLLGKWISKIEYKGEEIYLGVYLEEKIAAAKYLNALSLVNLGIKPESAAKPTSSKFKGVSLVKGRWRGMVYYKNKNYYLGFFDSERLANKACIEKRKELKNVKQNRL